MRCGRAFVAYFAIHSHFGVPRRVSISSNKMNLWILIPPSLLLCIECRSEMELVVFQFELSTYLWNAQNNDWCTLIFLFYMQTQKSACTSYSSVWRIVRRRFGAGSHLLYILYIFIEKNFSCYFHFIADMHCMEICDGNMNE